MKKRVLGLRGDVEGKSPDFKRELVEKLNYYRIQMTR